MIMGGIPHYLKEVRVGESATQAIDRICFTKDGLLQDEFKALYHSLFDHAGSHMEIIKALARKNTGLNRNEILKQTRLSSGGSLTRLLDEDRKSTRLNSSH